MSKVPYTVNVDEYICEALDQIRKMRETYDFSSLLAVVERVQHHANKMESALFTYRDMKYGMSRRANDETLSDEDFRKYVKDLVKKWSEDD